MASEQKPQPDQWWVSNDGRDIVYFNASRTRSGKLIVEWAVGDVTADTDSGWREWHHEPDCTGFDWKPETFPKWYVPKEKRVSAYGKEIAYYRHDRKDGGGETFHVDGTSFIFNVYDSSCRNEVTESEAKARLAPVESPEDWVEITDPEHVMRCDVDQFWGVQGTWETVLGYSGSELKRIESCRLRCRRKDLPEKPKTREVVFREYVYGDDEDRMFIEWLTYTPTGWEHCHQIGEPRTVTIPVD